MTTSAFTVKIPTPPALPTADASGEGTIKNDDSTLEEPRARIVSAASEDTRQMLESETEDEEVKMNCIGGLRGVQDSDMNTTDDDEDPEDDDDDDDDDQSRGEEREVAATDRNQGVVNFISVCRNTFPLVRPKATTPTEKRLSPHEEGDENLQDCSSDSSVDSDDDSSSVGARGVPLSIENQSAMSEDMNAGDDEHEDGDSENEDDDDGSTSSSSDSEGPEDEDMEPSSPLSKAHSSKASLGTDVQGTEGDGSGENVIDPELNDDELSDILQSLGEDRIAPVPEDLDSSERFIGVMEDREDLINVPKAKRVLSFNTLAALNMEARGHADMPKRQKCPKTSSSEASSSLLSMFSLGPPAMASMSDAARSSLHVLRDSPVISTSSDDEEEELDRQLGEELNTAPENDDCREKTPVPLLTPPGSPLTIEVNGDTTQVCEWPSNLAVETAMTAVSELRPMSPASLEDLGRQDRELEETHRRPSLEAGPSTLTPMLRGISVGND